MLKNQIVILSVKKELNHFGTLVGRSNPEYKLMKYLLNHFYQNEMLMTTPKDLTQKLQLSTNLVTAFIRRLVQAHVLIYQKSIFYLNTNFVLNP